MDIFIWIFIAVVFFGLELITTSFFLIWFGVASLAATILNYLGFDIYVQFGVFVLVSVALILTTRKFANKITPEPDKKTTADRLIGRNAKVIKKLNESEIIVKVSGEEWSAITNDEVNLDDSVKITGIESIKLIVEKID